MKRVCYFQWTRSAALFGKDRKQYFTSMVFKPLARFRSILRRPTSICLLYRVTSCTHRRAWERSTFAKELSCRRTLLAAVRSKDVALELRRYPISLVSVQPVNLRAFIMTILELNDCETILKPGSLKRFRTRI